MSSSSGTEAFINRLVRSVPLPPFFDSATFCMSSASSPPAVSSAVSTSPSSGAYSGSVAAMIVLVCRKTKSNSSSGTPMRSQTILSGNVAATSTMKSTSPRLCTRSMISEATVWTESSSFLSIRGVNPAETTRRNLACRGSSIAIMELKNSRNSTGISVTVMPCAELKTSARFDTWMMSAWLVSTQDPGPCSRAIPSGTGGSS